MDAEFEAALVHTNTPMDEITVAPQEHQRQIAAAGRTWIEARLEGWGGD